MERRNFLKSAFIGSAALLVGYPFANSSAASNLKIKKIRYYSAPGYNKPLFNQARGIVEIETNGGIIGIGEGGSKDMIEQCAQMIIGEDPFKIEHIWQYLYRGMFYPPGREKLHALGALEMALWDIKGKALGVPVYELMGGATGLNPTEPIASAGVIFPAASYAGSVGDHDKACTTGLPVPPIKLVL